MISVPSNLGKGLVWYFICPVTFKRCRKLYAVGMGSQFVHRTAYQSVYYETQLRSKTYRNLDKTLGAYFTIDKLYSELYSKGFTKYYKGRATRRYSRIKSKLEQAERVPHSEVERLLYPFPPKE